MGFAEFGSLAAISPCGVPKSAGEDKLNNGRKFDRNPEG
jgi:hypothetical protein